MRITKVCEKPGHARQSIGGARLNCGMRPVVSWVQVDQFVKFLVGDAVGVVATHVQIFTRGPAILMEPAGLYRVGAAVMRSSRSGGALGSREAGRDQCREQK